MREDATAMTHRTELRVRFYELDPYDHVNHTNYLAYFETARIEYLTDLGFGMDVLKRQGHQLVVVELAARFVSTAGLHDALTITTEVGEVGRATSTWHQEMWRGDELIATLDVKAAFTDLAGRPKRVPVDFRAAALPPDAREP
ncbi:thioesterase family protein [soil metagenome]